MLPAPVVVPPLTPWARSVRVRGQRTGATVRVLADGETVGAASAPGPDAFIDLDRDLRPGERVSAMQDYSGEVSVQSPVESAVTVLAEPNALMLGGLFSRAPLLQCGSCLWLEGIVPGADVTCLAPSPPATVSASWTGVDVQVSPLAAGEDVLVQQGRGGIVGATVKLPAPLAQRVEQPIPSPTIQEPLYECDRFLSLEGVFPGSTITVDHDGDVTEFCWGSTRGTFWLGRGLQRSDVVRVKQEFRPCGIHSAERHYGVSLAEPPLPSFPYPVCAGDREIEVHGLRTGALVQFLIGAGSGKIVTAEAGEPPHRFILPPLGNVERLGCRQSLCGGNGPWSETAWTDLVFVGAADEPSIAGPLYACAAAVGVWWLSAGSRVYVMSAFWGGGAIGEAFATGDGLTTVPLLFGLVPGDEIWLEVLRCGHRQRAGDAVFVQAAPEFLPAPELSDPLDDAGATITVRNLIPGAFCDVERADTDSESLGVLIGSEPVTRDEASVPVPALPPGTRVRVRQRLCAVSSQLSAVVTTGDRPLTYAHGSTDRICQLTGVRGHGMRPPKVDPTPIGLVGTDLGIPVLHQGRLYLFFGDCDRPDDVDEDDWTLPAADPIAWTTDPPGAPGDGPSLHWLVGSGGLFHRLHVDGLAPLELFGVPTGGFSYLGRLYVFVADERTGDGPGSRMNTSHLAVTKRLGGINDTLELLYTVASTIDNRQPRPPAGRWLVHVSPTVVRNADWPGLPASAAGGDGLVLFGTEVYHDSNLFLAYCPLDTSTVSVPLGPTGLTTWTPSPVPHPSEWFYWFGPNPAPLGSPSSTDWRRASDIDFDDPTDRPTELLAGQGGLGEISATWCPALRRWLVVHLSPGQVVIRSARYPWGPWSGPAVIFDGLNPAFQATADNLQSGHQFVGLPTDNPDEGPTTGPYAPYLIPTWSRFDHSLRQLTFHYTMSTMHPPYNSQLMVSRLQFS